jgi:hypothetical protein
MKVNKNNLSIAAHCTDRPFSGFASDVLHLIEGGTLAVNGPYSIFVSALDTGVSGCITVKIADSIRSKIGDEGFTISQGQLLDVAGKIPPTNKHLADKPVLFEIVIETERLAQMAQLAVEHGGKAIRFRFTGEEDPVRLDTRNMETGQRWEALVMPNREGTFEEIFLANDFDNALLKAAAL